jgi:WD40 repeat protein
LLLAAVAVAALGIGLGSVSVTPGSQPPARATADTGPGRARPPAADALGDPLPDGTVARLGTTRLRHGNSIFFAAYTHDGKALLTAGMDRAIRLWDLSTGKELCRFDCGKVARAGQDHPRSYAAALSPDGKVVAASRDGTLSLWDTATEKLLHEVATGQPGDYGDHLAFAPNGKAVLTVSRKDQSALVWDVASGKNTKRLAEPSPSDSPFAVAVAVSPDWKYLASVHRKPDSDSDTVKIKDLTADRELPEIKVEAGRGNYNTLTFSADSKVLAWQGVKEEIVLWDVGAHKERRSLDAGASLISAIALSGDGKFVAFSHHYDMVEVWDTGTGKQVVSAGKPIHRGWAADRMGSWIARQSFAALAFSPDAGELVASFGGPSILRLDATSAKPAAETGGHADAALLLGLSGDGKAVVTYGRREPLRSWDLATGREVRQVAIPENADCAACSADGQRLAAAFVEDRPGGFMRTVTVYDAAGKALRQFDPGQGGVASLAFSPDGRILAVRKWDPPSLNGSQDASLWDTTTGKQLVALAEAQGVALRQEGEAWGLMTLDLAFSPDGRAVFGAGGKRQLICWDSRTGEAVWTVDLGRRQAAGQFALSADGHALATLNTDGTVTLYEAATGEQRARLGEPDEKREGKRLDKPIALAFSADGHYLATAKDSPVIRLWDLIAGQEVGHLKGHQGNVGSLLFTSDGTRLLSGSLDTTALTWDLSQALKGKAVPAGKLEAAALDGLWADLAGKDATKAFAALRKLAGSPAQAVALVKERLKPVAPADPKDLAALIAGLESEEFAVRQKAEARLEALGELAEPHMRKALDGGPAPALRQRLERLLQRLSGQAPPASLVRDLRAVELLELAATGLAGPRARGVLDELARGAAGARLTREAKAAAQRLAKRL